jgi:tRNA dimethylallyltransferase
LESVLTGYNMPEAAPDQELRKILSLQPKKQLQEILQVLKPRLHNKTDLDDPERLIRAIEIERARALNGEEQPAKPEIDAVVLGVSCERSELRSRITSRLKERLAQGMIEEVKNLHSAGLIWKKLESFGLEYRFISQYLQNKITYDEMINKLNTSIHQFAKRQETWFRRMEKKGIVISWIPANNYPLLKKTVMKFLR